MAPRSLAILGRTEMLKYTETHTVEIHADVLVAATVEACEYKACYGTTGMICAIKKIRELTGCSLKTAKDVFEDHIRKAVENSDFPSKVQTMEKYLATVDVHANSVDVKIDKDGRLVGGGYFYEGQSHYGIRRNVEELLDALGVRIGNEY